MSRNLSIEQINFTEIDFWSGFMASSFPTALDEESDLSLAEIIEENKLSNVEWWDEFTGYYNGVLEEADGYVNNPRSFIYELTVDQTLKIEFHPGDIVFYINDKKIGCTGGEYLIQIFRFEHLLDYFQERTDEVLFLLLLPLVEIEANNVDKAMNIINEILKKIFENSLAKQIARSIVYGLIEE